MSQDKSKMVSEETNEFQKRADSDLSLKSVVPESDELYKSIQDYILLNPEITMASLGDTITLISQGDEARAKGDYTKARLNYEYAAKISMYKQDKENLKKSLLLADEVSDSDEDKAKHQKLLDNIDAVLRISREYPGRRAAQPKEDEKNTPEPKVTPEADKAVVASGGEMPLPG
jgi:hypothetical protein